MVKYNGIPKELQDVLNETADEFVQRVTQAHARGQAEELSSEYCYCRDAVAMKPEIIERKLGRKTESSIVWTERQLV